MREKDIAELTVDKVESLFGSDEVIGIMMEVNYGEELLSIKEYDKKYGHLGKENGPDTASLMPDGSSAICCTNYAHYVRNILGNMGFKVDVVGFSNEDNPTSLCAIDEYHPGGHDFAIVDDRYLIDPWVRLVAAVEEQIFYDLSNPADAAKANVIYGPRQLWLSLDNIANPGRFISRQEEYHEQPHMRAGAEIPAHVRLAYMDHLCSRIFARNDYGSMELLIAAINHAKGLPPETEWRARKHAFNEIGEKAPFGDGEGYLLKYEEVPAFIEKETDAFFRFFSSDFTATEIPRFKLLHSGENPNEYTVDVSRTGDSGIYEEVRIGVFKGEGKECLADVLLGLTEDGEPRVMITAGGDGENEHAFAVYPLRDVDEALEQLNARAMKP